LNIRRLGRAASRPWRIRQTKRQFLAGIKAPGYYPSQAVTEQSTVEVYDDSAVVVGVFFTPVLKESGKC
jgi:hypothetical protein